MLILQLLVITFIPKEAHRYLSRASPISRSAWSAKKLREGHGYDVKEIYLSHGKRGRLRQSNAQQGAGAGHMLFRRVLAKILQRVQRLIAFLYFVKDNQRVLRSYGLAARHDQILQDAAHILCRFEELLILFVIVEVKIGDIAVMQSSELLKYPCFAYLPEITLLSQL